MTVKLTLLYNVPDDTEEFDRYYLETHIPLAEKLAGVQRLEVSRVIGENETCHIVTELWFEDLDTMASMSSAHGDLVRDDVANFAPKGAVRLVSEVVR